MKYIYYNVLLLFIILLILYLILIFIKFTSKKIYSYLEKRQQRNYQTLYDYITMNIFQKSSYNIDSFTTNNYICCIYCYFEKNDIYKNNFIYFLSNAILENVDYYICINGECSVNLNNYKDKKNINFIIRKNKCYDFGAYSYLLKKSILKSYEYYFFMNTSVKGPYLKENTNKDWTIPFIELFNSDNIKIVGTTINIWTIRNESLISLYGKKDVYTHVQSMFFCLKKEYLDFLLKKGFFNYKETCKLDFNELIQAKEISLSQVALNKNWNINCILPRYRNLNYLNINKDINPSSTNGDPYYKNGYFYNTIDPYDVIFFKNTRF